jgi:methylmalonyl-CoA/ethylmalonyl-CoA epimerase
MTTKTPRIAHLGIAVRDLDAAVAFYRDVLGMPAGARETVGDQGVEVAFVHAGEPEIELLHPTRPDSPVGRFLDRRGEGLHHVCLEVTDIRAELARLSALGVPLVDREPRIGAGGHLVAFLHPKGARGVLIELEQKRSE